MDQAAEHLAKGQVPYARDAQRRASENVERGAQQAEDLAAELRAERLALATTDGARPARRTQPPLGEARAAVAGPRASSTRLASRPRPPPAGRPRGDASGRPRPYGRRAGGGSRYGNPASAIAGPAGSEPSERRRIARRLLDRSEDPPRPPAETDLAELKEAVRRGTGRNWGELPGHLRTEILQSAHGRYRDDYARLIQLYFREIAAGPAEKPAEDDQV